MSSPAFQPLADVADLEVFGISRSRIDADDIIVQRHLDVASARVLGVLHGICKLPLVSWGDDIREKVCILAAFSLRALPGADPLNSEWAQLTERKKLVEDWFTALSERPKAQAREFLVGVVDSYDASTATVPERSTRLVWGYPVQLRGDYY